MSKVKYPIGAYAPGNYMNTCSNCKGGFYGDKRASQCEPCAINELTEQAAHWHEAYGKSEAENSELKMILNGVFKHLPVQGRSDRILKDKITKALEDKIKSEEK